ncbi:MAG: hypothetical protein SNJ63_10245, partial [Sphingomonadaceae bacterium]
MIPAKLPAMLPTLLERLLALLPDQLEPEAENPDRFRELLESAAAGAQTPADEDGPEIVAALILPADNRPALLLPGMAEAANPVAPEWPSRLPAPAAASLPEQEGRARPAIAVFPEAPGAEAQLPEAQLPGAQRAPCASAATLPAGPAGLPIPAPPAHTALAVASARQGADDVAAARQASGRVEGPAPKSDAAT